MKRRPPITIRPPEPGETPLSRIEKLIAHNRRIGSQIEHVAPQGWCPGSPAGRACARASAPALEARQ